MIGIRLVLVLSLSAISMGTGAVNAQSPADASAVERFEKSVRPVLVEHCQRCHGAEKSKGGLRLDSAEALAKGGDTGPAIDLDEPSKSLFLDVIRYNGELKMPPKGKLSDAEIAALAQWVKDGARWPDSATMPQNNVIATAKKANKPAPNSLEAGKAFWAFQPIRDPIAPEVKTAGWARSPIDRFILAGLESKGFAPAPEAEKRTLIRRATFDLIGLPPTPEEVEAFLKDESPEAFSGVINRLLASPRYGERWGRHWLDLARYADSNGMDENMAHANAYQYRDYVIKAFNADKPYDQFLKEQIAGDLLPKTGDEAVNNDRLTATGFLVIGPKMLAEDDPLKMEMDIIDEQVDTVGRVFMGLTIGCARCHDHKFDPIPTADYYSLAGIFKSTKSMANHRVVAMWNEHPLTARVMVNRLWLGHFGMGLVRSPDNFGRLGDAPVHADLLDWLASRFIESGWSIKSLHRAIMLSSTYRMSTQDNPAAALADPENRLHWKMPRKRLEAEAIRDALLSVCGRLDTEMKGSLLNTPNHAYVNNTGGVGGINYAVARRAVYLPVIRSGLYDVFQAFDFADPSASNGLRVPTTVAPQALFMMNDPLVITSTQALADSLLADKTLNAP